MYIESSEITESCVLFKEWRLPQIPSIFPLYTLIIYFSNFFLAAS
jgi:hypothetical protein